MSIECAFFGFLAADAEPRTSQAGKQWARLRVGVGKDDAMQWVSVAVFGKAAEIAAELKKGDRVYCEGTIKIDTWRGGDGADKRGLSVSSFKIEKTHQIGRNRPKRGKPSSGREVAARSAYAPIGRADADLNDDIPF
jgi:single-stranded DNA-binding protein